MKVGRGNTVKYCGIEESPGTSQELHCSDAYSVPPLDSPQVVITLISSGDRPSGDTLHFYRRGTFTIHNKLGYLTIAIHFQILKRL